MTERREGQPANPRPPKRAVNGILLLDKPVGMTSNRVLQQVKRRFNARKAGHTGSLDPLATGLLPLCFGQATKISHWLLDADKVYEVRLAIGTQTDTADADGEVVARSDKTTIEASELEAAMASHIGELDQVPPMYSALKQGGQRLYKLARQGVEVERKARRITVHDLEVLEFDAAGPLLRVRCSKGTYIRTLVETLAEHMGTCGHVAALRRTELGPFVAPAMVTMQQIDTLDGDFAALDSLLVPADAALGAFPAVNLNADEAFYLRNGHAVGHAPRDLEGIVRLYDPEERFLGLGEVRPEGTIAPKRLFVGG